MRVFAVWAVLFAAYAATLGVDAVGTGDYAADEPRHLLAAESIVSDGDIDLADEFASRAYAGFHPQTLRPQGRVVLGRRLEPQGFGFGLLIAPAYALGGAQGVELFLAAVAALGFALAALLARRIVPEPWASGAAVLVGLSPPALALSTTVYPDLMAGAMLAGATLAAMRVRERPELGSAVAGATLLALLPWLGPKYLLPAAPVAVALVRWTARRGRRTAALAAAEIMVASLVVYVTLNDRLYGGITPSSVAASGAPATGASSLGDYLERIPRLAALWIDRDVGLLRWAPVLALSGFAAWLLWRSRREHIARVAAARADAEVAAGLSLLVCAGVVAVAAIAAPSLAGEWFPARHLAAGLPPAAALAAWGLRHAPRTGAVLGALTLLGSLWLVLAFAFGGADGWVHPGVDAPLGPAVALLPRADVGSVWFAVLAGVLAAALAALVAREWWRARAERLL
jgi:hypothetical protein